MYNPISTYRIQFNQSFTLKELEKQMEYLSLLGIGSIYASPVFAATPGSVHGYDIINPHTFNPEITTTDEFLRVCEQLKSKDMGWLQDIVPNHMAYHPDNKWLMDVLEKGIYSMFHKVFDFEPNVPEPNNKLMVPFLGTSLEEVLQNNELRLGWKNGNFSINYFDNSYPVNFESFFTIIETNLRNAPISFKKLWKELLNKPVKAGKGFLNGKWEKTKIQLASFINEEKEARNFIDNILHIYNSDTKLLKKVLNNQYYELCHWQETEKRINYRRFFTVNGLICLNMQNPEVFETFHRFIAEMIQKKCFNGLRIDHIDGLNDPNGYLENLRKLTGKDTYIVAEKILEHDEDFPEFWPIQGNTGYDFLATVNNLLTSVKDYQKLRSLYKEVTQISASPTELIYSNKKMILTTRMHGEWDNISNFFFSLGFIDFNNSKEVGREEIKEALGEFMLACPVYRLYPRKFPLDDANRKTVAEIFEKAHKCNPALKSALQRLADIILNKEKKNKEYNRKLSLFFARLMQFTGPLMAKGVEDTSMYQYNCFIAHNEVGDAINAKGITIEEYHRQMLQRQKKWPLTMNNTSTHDTKRGEDVRARLNVISELAVEWEEQVHQWMQMNQKLKTRLESGLLEPSLSVEYFIYQTLLGTFPFDGKVTENYMQRIDEYLVKALREAKRKVSWRDPDETYENTICRFARNMLDPGHDFMKAFVPFQQKIAWRGVVNSISQLTLKCTSPGVPDIYQGTELWDLTLVDPDNRQPVDYEMRHKTLQSLIKKQKANHAAMMRDLNENPFDGRIKLWLTYILLNERKRNPDLFFKGEYIPLSVHGHLKNHIIAFARKYKQDWMLVIVPLITGNLSEKSTGEYFTEISWKNTHILLPDHAPDTWENIITTEKFKKPEGLKVSHLLKHSWVGVLHNK
ncbi:MAG: malto-oligosyltrehalose synthase [Bacteroidetes bacterium]|nr:MAG: malto-oligosyltrehalose synthase [Bacteroidota bacterium]